MKKLILILVLALFLVMTLNSGVLAFDLETSLGNRSGYATYTINDSSDSWQSELEFPLDYNIVELNYNSEVVLDNVKSFHFSYLTNTTDNPEDPFKDSDWTTTEGVGEPDIYAEAQSEVGMSEIDLSVLSDYNLLTNGEDSSLRFGFGYKRSDHNYLIKGPGFQKDYRNDTEISFGKDEELLEYDLEIKAPYVSLNSKTSLFEGELKFFPRVTVEDFDHHILRGKYNEGEATGNGIEFNLKYKKQLKERLFFNAQFDFESIKAEGTQTQWFEDSDQVFEVNQQIEYTHKTIKAGLTYLF